MLLSTTRREAEARGEPRGVDVVGGAGDGAGAERHRVGLVRDAIEAIDVAADRGRVRQPDMRDEHRLRPAQMRVRRHHRRPARSACSTNAATSAASATLNHGHAAFEVQPEIDGDLLVARAAGVQALAGVANRAR